MKPYTEKVDLWSVGTIVYQMLTKKPPFHGSDHMKLLAEIQSGKRLIFPKSLTEHCKNLLQVTNKTHQLISDSAFK